MDDALMEMIGQYRLEQVRQCNEYAARFGLRLNEQQLAELVDYQRSVLREEERVELTDSALPKLIRAFCGSPYVYQGNFAAVIGALQEVFYLYKNETLDWLSDDELIEYMQRWFNGPCQGSVEYLEETLLERLARQVRGWK